MTRPKFISYFFVSLPLSLSYKLAAKSGHEACEVFVFSAASDKLFLLTMDLSFT